MGADDLVRMKDLGEKYKEKFGRERPDIRHIVVLMLENRTFDGVQGHYMNQKYENGEVARSKWDADGQDLFSYSNNVEGPDGTVEFPCWTWPEGDENVMSKDTLSIPCSPAGP